MARHSPPLVAHVIYALTTGGLENGLVNILNRSPVDRYRHVIICITRADDFAARITADNVRIIELNKQAGHDVGFYWRLWKVFRELRPDIVHSRNLAALETQLLSFGCPGVKRVHGEHGREEHDPEGTHWKYLAYRKAMRALIHRYIAVSRDLERWLVEVVDVKPQNVRQIYNGVDYQRFSPDNVKNSALLPPAWQAVDGMLVIGTVGRLTPVKDQHTLLRAVADLRSMSPGLSRQVRLIIIGDGPQRQSLAALAQELGLAETTWFAGARDDVPTLLKIMDVFALPSLAEGISNTVLEAMACGVPVVATAVGGNVELIEEGFNGSLVPVGEPQALARALTVILENEMARARQGANARQRVCRRFDWPRTVDAYLAVYDELLDLPDKTTVEIAG